MDHCAYELVKKLELTGLLKETLEGCLLQYNVLTAKIERFSQRIEELSHQERYEKPVTQLRCLKGVDTTEAMTIHVEISDFTRFSNTKAFTAYLGLTPSEQSSGEKVNRNGISKQGNLTVRSTLVECVNVLVKCSIGIKARQSKVIVYADQTIERLQRKYHRMIYQGKPRNVAITVIARELACFNWGMETRKMM